MSTRFGVRTAIAMLASDELDALARFAERIGLDVTPDDDAPLTRPLYVVTGPGGKEAALTLAGRDTPVAALVWRDPARTAGDARIALIAMTVPTVHRHDDPPEATA